MTDDKARDKAIAAMIQEALVEPFDVTVQERTNSEQSPEEAIKNKRYIKLDSPGGPYVNFDRFLAERLMVISHWLKPIILKGLRVASWRYS